MGTLITLFSAPLEQKLLRKAAVVWREWGETPWRGWEWPCWWNLHSLSKALEWLLPAVLQELDKKCVFCSSPLEPWGKKGYLRMSRVGHSWMGCLLSCWECFVCIKCLDLVFLPLHFSRSRHVGRYKCWFSQHWGKIGQTSSQKGWDTHLHSCYG